MLASGHFVGVEGEGLRRYVAKNSPPGIRQLAEQYTIFQFIQAIDSVYNPHQSC